MEGSSSSNEFGDQLLHLLLVLVTRWDGLLHDLLLCITVAVILYLGIVVILGREYAVNRCVPIMGIEMLLEKLGDLVLHTLQIHQEGVVESLFRLWIKGLVQANQGARVGCTTCSSAPS
jgi:hypothetical protein